MSRLYVAETIVTTSPDAEEVVREQLVEGDNPSQVRNFISRETIKVRYAEQHDIVRLLEKGVKPVSALDPNARQPTLPNV